MRTSLTLSLDTRRERKDGTFPIIIRLSHFQKTTSISTGQTVPKKYWNNNKRLVRASYPGVRSVSFLNNLLVRQLSDAQEIINRLQDNRDLGFISIKGLRQRIEQKNKYQSFYVFADELIKNLHSQQQLGTARIYSDVIKQLKNFTDHKDVKFNELNYQFLKSFEKKHLSKKGNTVNGLATYMRTIRAIYNKGIKQGLIEKQSYPFEDYKIKTNPTAKRALSINSFTKIFALELDIDSNLFHYRNYFVLSYMLFGMSFIDMAFLKVNNLVDGRLKFQRKKTSKTYDIKITEPLKVILNFYAGNKSKEQYILPIIKRNTLELQYKDIKWARKRYNKGLKEIAKICEIDERLTSYVSRHSFATHAMLKNVPLVAISAMLGHSKLSTTQIYLKSLPNNILDTYQEEMNTIV